MKHLFIFFPFFFLSIIVNAQSKAGNGHITGKVTDALTKAPVDYATITIFKQGSTTPLNGTITDAKGNFDLKNLPLGEYEVTADFIGYQRKSINHILITVNKLNFPIGTIVLSPVQNQLKGVTITGTAATVENKIDKMVYNPANDLSAQGGVAIDVLKKVPMISVDIDGNVELQGNPNIRFLINGKPSSIFGASLADALQSIPASQIKSIEVITSPGAKYDANGTGGIVNIILKESKVEGFNGSVNLAAGTRRENGSINLNLRKGNFGVNAYLTGNDQINSTTINTTDRLSYNNARDTSTHLLQKGNSGFVRSGYNSGLSLNWSITPKDELTAAVGFNHFGNHNSGLTNQEQNMQSVATNNSFSDILSLRNSNSRFSANAVDYSLDYKKTFKKEGQELDILYNTSNSKNTSDFFQQQDYLTGKYPSTGSMSNNPGKDRQSNISVDYTHPFSEKFTLETGAKGVFETINNNVITDTLSKSDFVPNSNQTYGFNYSRQIYAYYLSAQFSLFHDFIEGKAGLRDEYTTSTADFPGTHLPSYNILAPSAVLSHKIDKTQTIKLSYTYRIQRPDYGDLNPFYNISDPHNISTGNPNLKPEIGHNYELGYNKSYEKGANFYAGAFYRHNTNDIQAYTTQYDTLNIGGTKYSNVFLNQRYNIGTETTTGVNLFGSVPVSDKFNLRSNMFFGERITTNPGNPTVSGFTYRINLNASYNFAHDLTAEIFGNYNASQRTIQGTRPAFAFYNIALRKQLFNKKASIGLTAANPFNQYVNQKSVVMGTNFYQTNLRQVQFQSFGISLSYKFGKLEFKKEKEKDDNNEQPPLPDQPNQR
ncbi:outer membrane beta-barrel family protein [Mucilaginibacter arboris]|uniref:TonB-dependent receptor n=1 Tax=Mucilaginibacter arboris TaxID=2682090 RepID=A0A7K1T159_9SPHI|nr:outer membrane beta-barrel family protein [Mucilaginibacter arboris]MVN23313.1 TonB-dependent receptor [Mucilaginibacter arboris]